MVCTQPPLLPPCQASRLQPVFTLCMHAHTCTPTRFHTFTHSLTFPHAHTHTCHTRSVRHHATPSRGNPFSSGLWHILSRLPLLPSLPTAGSTSFALPEDLPFPAELCLAIHPDGFSHSLNTEEAQVCRYLLPKLPLGLYRPPCTISLSAVAFITSEAPSNSQPALPLRPLHGAPSPQV